jgi:hypothetical protein
LPVLPLFDCEAPHIFLTQGCSFARDVSMASWTKYFKAFGIGGVNEPEPDAAVRIPKQALIVNFSYGLDSANPFFELDEVLHEAFLDAAPAEYDGHEIAMDNSDGTFYFYGPEADDLLRRATPVLLKYPFMKGASCMRRYGDVDDENALEVTTVLGQLPS